MKDADEILEAWGELIAGMSGRGLYAAIGAWMAAHEEGHRRYHTVEHIAECLEELEAFGERNDFRRLVGAVMYHDFVYDPKARDNEEKSAEAARAALAGLGWAAGDVDAVARIILATRHAAMPAAEDEAIVVDADLAILGRERERFERYERDVRAEFSHVPEEAFRKGRAEVLRKFLGRERIYATGHFFEKYEKQARENLRRSVERLADH